MIFYIQVNRRVNMYRGAKKEDIDEIVKIDNVDMSKRKIEDILRDDQQYVFVYAKDDNKILGVSFAKSQDIEEYDYDSEIYGIYTKNVKDRDLITSDLLYNTQKELFNLGFRNLVIWCNEKDKKQRKNLEASGGVEAKQRENNGQIQIAYRYELTDSIEM